MRAEEEFAAIEVGAKGHSLVVQLAKLGQAVNLKASAVGEYGTLPTHEGTQSTMFIYQVMARSKSQMIGVPQDNLGFYRLEEVANAHILPKLGRVMKRNVIGIVRVNGQGGRNVLKSVKKNMDSMVIKHEHIRSDRRVLGMDARVPKNKSKRDIVT
mgnify:CR=1 FL=1